MAPYGRCPSPSRACRLPAPARGFRRLLVAGTVLVLGLATAPVSWRATVSSAMAAGSLTESIATAPAVSVTLNGTDQAPTSTMDISVADSRGTGAGWNLTITSTQFSTGGASPRTLSTAVASITAVAAATTCVPSSTCVAPTNSVTYPVPVPAGPVAPAAVKFYNAALNTGLGTFTISPTIRLAIPANAYAGSYTSTITVSIVTGP